MSRGKAIAGMGLCALVLLGVLAALAQTAEKPPTELYVRTSPPNAEILVDGENHGRSPALFAVEPGEHSITVKLEGYGPKTGTVTIPDGRIRRIIFDLERSPNAVVASPAGPQVAARQPTASPRKLMHAGLGAGVLAVALSPSGKTVATVDEGGAVMLLNARNGALTQSFSLLTPQERQAIFRSAKWPKILTGGIAFSPDGATLAVGGGPVVKLYDVASGQLDLTFVDKRLVEGAAGSEGPSPPALLPGGGERGKGVGKPVAVPYAHGSVFCVAFSPDGKLLATSGDVVREVGEDTGATPGHLKLWDVKTGELKRDLGDYYPSVRSVAFSPDGKTLASVGTHPPEGTSSVRLWDPQTGTVKSVLPIARGGIPWSVAFSPDGKLVAACALVHEGDGGGRQGERGCKLLVWNTQTGAPLGNRPVPGLAQLSFSADSKTLAAGVDGKGVSLWNPETLEPKGEIQPSSDSLREVRVAFSPIGNLLAVGAKDAKQGSITVWEIGAGADQPASAAAPAPAPPADEEDAVGAMKRLGAEVKVRSDRRVSSISLKGKPVTDADLVHIEKLTGLEELDLSGTQITDAGLAHLEGLAGLEALDLSGTRVTDAAAGHLNKLAKLHRLDVTNTQFTADGVRQLFLPELYQFGYRGPEPPKLEPNKVLLVKAEGAGEKSVLDLASGETLPLSEQAMRDPSAFTRLGKGDFWYDDGRIVCLRGAAAIYLDNDTGIRGERYAGRPETTSYKLPEAQRIEYLQSGEKKYADRPRRLRITTAEKRHFVVAILSVTKEGDALLEYQSADNPFKTEWDPTFRLELAGVAATDLDTGATTSNTPLVEKWPDAFELVWNESRRAVMCRQESPTRVLLLPGVKGFHEATDQALKRFKELEASGEHGRLGAVSDFDEPGAGPDDARYFAFITNRENLAIVEIVPPRQTAGETAKGWIRWSVGEVEGFRGDVPPLVTPVRRLPAADQRAIRR